MEGARGRESLATPRARRCLLTRGAELTALQTGGRLPLRSHPARIRCAASRRLRGGAGLHALLSHTILGPCVDCRLERRQAQLLRAGAARPVRPRAVAIQQQLAGLLHSIRLRLLEARRWAIARVVHTLKARGDARQAVLQELEGGRRPS
jgi:hypothetical protein